MLSELYMTKGEECVAENNETHPTSKRYGRWRMMKFFYDFLG